MAMIPDQYLDLLGSEKKAFASIATVQPDGSPQVTPVWFDFVNGRVRVNTAKGRVKARNMQEGVRVALSIMDPDNAYRYVQVRGKVTRMTEEGARAHIDTLSRKYIGKEYPWSRPGEVRVMYEIEPIAAQGMG
jgi:PPOX class probable F420-dependent enzyme